MLDPPGFFGKVPARGDFVSRRVGPALAARWDAWLGLLTTAVREAAGADWPEAWLTAPLWHFALGADVVAAPGLAGVLVASADRVGRLFPFTVIGPASGVPDDAWCDAAERLTLESLDDGFDPDALDAALVELGPPAQGAFLDSGTSLWRCRGSDRVEPTSRLVAGLPGRSEAVSMILGSAAETGQFLPPC